MGIRTSILLLLVMSGLWTRNAIANDIPKSYDNFGLGNFSGRSLTIHDLLRPHDFGGMVDTAGGGRWRVTASSGYGNIWAYAVDDYRFDGEWLFFDLQPMYGITKAVDAGFYLPFSYRSGGFLDRAVENFHERFGLEQDRRDEFPRNKAIILREEGEQQNTIQEGSSSGINDIALFLNWKVSPGDDVWPALVLQPRVTLPTGDEIQLEGLGETSIGLSLLFAKRMGKSSHYLYSVFDATYSDAELLQSIQMNSTVFSGSFAWEYRWSLRTSILARYQVYSGLADDFGEWSEPAHHVTAGFKRVILGHALLELGLQQNIIAYNNSTDIALRFALTVGFQETRAQCGLPPTNPKSRPASRE